MSRLSKFYLFTSLGKKYIFGFKNDNNNNFVKNSMLISEEQNRSGNYITSQHLLQMHDKNNKENAFEQEIMIFFISFTK